MAGTPEKDAISGQSTTGHEWDGIKELNTPLPKWWVYVFYVCILWSIGYWVVYPAWPTATGYTQGMFGYSSRAALEGELDQARAAHGARIDGLGSLSVTEIAANADLANYARAGGAVLFKENCVPCHQSGGAGAFGYPTLADDSWIWGGDLESIEYTLTNGIRSDLSADTRLSEMPRYGDFMEASDITAVAQYVKGMSEGTVAEGRGQEVFVEQCAACHSSDGANPVSDGNPAMGAPALGDKVWLYAAPGQQMSVEEIAAQVRNPKHSVMPAWGGRLKATDIKMLTLYVHSLGGGQ
ncbi:cytochrome-c oxidase, cbb3-type subunit III [Novispirillum sp. DQ9]|uniref:cytochrome-c oxidase, cbb3-type subunit III n=1 Tax=Novispirillum sp. DQ9 TaxID=3398612 RepID=UPI003C7DDA0C